MQGVRHAWGYPEGGMGAVSAAIARSAQAQRSTAIGREKYRYCALIGPDHAVVTTDLLCYQVTAQGTFLTF